MLPIPVKSDKSKGTRGRTRFSGRTKALTGAAAVAALALTAAACGSSGSSSGNGSPAPAKGHAGGTYTILANSAFGVADPAQNYTLQEWQLLIDTHDGLTQFKRVGGAAGHQDRA